MPKPVYKSVRRRTVRPKPKRQAAAFQSLSTRLDRAAAVLSAARGRR